MRVDDSAALLQRVVVRQPCSNALQYAIDYRPLSVMEQKVLFYHMGAEASSRKWKIVLAICQCRVNTVGEVTQSLLMELLPVPTQVIIKHHISDNTAVAMKIGR